LIPGSKNCDSFVFRVLPKAQKKGPQEARYFAGLIWSKSLLFPIIYDFRGLFQWRGHTFPCRKFGIARIGKPGHIRARNSTGLPRGGGYNGELFCTADRIPGSGLVMDL
jgi:hypothetical protein